MLSAVLANNWAIKPQFIVYAALLSWTNMLQRNYLYLIEARMLIENTGYTFVEMPGSRLMLWESLSPDSGLAVEEIIRIKVNLIVI